MPDEELFDTEEAPEPGEDVGAEPDAEEVQPVVETPEVADEPEEAAPEPEAPSGRDERSVEDYVRATLANANSITQVPQRLLPEVLRQREAVIRNQTVQQTQFQLEVGQRIQRFNQALEAEDGDVLVELLKKAKDSQDPHDQAAFRAWGQQQLQQPAVTREAMAQMQAASRNEGRYLEQWARLEGNEAAQATIGAAIANGTYGSNYWTDENLNRLKRDINAALRPAEPPAAPVRTPRVDVGGGMGNQGAIVLTSAELDAIPTNEWLLKPKEERDRLLAAAPEADARLARKT